MGENSNRVNFPFCEYFFTKISRILNFMTEVYLYFFDGEILTFWDIHKCPKLLHFFAIFSIERIF